MEIIYQDNRILVCLKPFGVVSTDEPGGLPDLVRQSLGGGAQCVRTERIIWRQKSARSVS